MLPMVSIRVAKLPPVWEGACSFDLQCVCVCVCVCLCVCVCVCVCV